MAKTSKIVKNNKREQTANFYSSKRKELLDIVRDPESSYDEKREAQKKIAKMHVMPQQQDIEIDVK